MRQFFLFLVLRVVFKNFLVEKERRRKKKNNPIYIYPTNRVNRLFYSRKKKNTEEGLFFIFLLISIFYLF